MTDCSTRRSQRNCIRSRLVFWVVGLLSFFTVACQVTDISRIYELEAPSEGSSSEIALQLPRVTRMSVDFVLENTGSSAATYTVQAQAQTSGNTEDAACSLFAGASVRTVQSSNTDEDPTIWSQSGAPLVRELGSGVRILRPADASAGLVEIRIRTASFYRLVASTPITGLRIASEAGVEILPTDYVDDTFACARAGVNALYTLSEGVYFIELSYSDPDSDEDPLLLIDRECSELRRVSRTCPGAASDVAVRTTSLEAGTRYQNRLSASDLGVGDVLVVGMSCDGTCEGQLDFTVATTELDCRVSSDCSGRRTCSEEGYCEVPVSSSGCTAGHSPRSGAGDLLLAAFAAVLLVARRRPVSFVRLSPALVAVAILTLAPDVAAEERRVEVFFGAGVQSRAFSGEVGRYSSPGFGASMSQGVWFGRFGFHLTLSGDSYLTTQPGPPLNRGTQSFTATAGPRFGGYVRDFKLWGGVDIMNTTMITNTLVRYTGDQRSFTAPALSAGIRWDGFAPFFVEFVPSVAWFRTMDTRPSMRSFHVNLGVLGGR